jgi:hypothetical protein
MKKRERGKVNKIVAFSNDEKYVLGDKTRCMLNDKYALNPENIQFRVTCGHKLPACCFRS